MGGKALVTVTVVVIGALQPPVIYVITDVPGITPVTTPVEEDIEATEGVLLDHVPPPARKLNEAVAPVQTDVPPVMAAVAPATEIVATR
jgi:hypothetical protein